jgi:transcriptional regulator with XRE-family HTH domain
MRLSDFSWQAAPVGVNDGVNSQLDALGAFIRAQRKLAHLSLRDLADRAQVSNPYLSQIERGLHEPSMRVLRSIAKALNLSAETILAEAGLFDGDTDLGDADQPADAEIAVRADPYLTVEQKDSLLSVYRSFRQANVP